MSQNYIEKEICPQRGGARLLLQHHCVTNSMTYIIYHREQYHDVAQLKWQLEYWQSQEGPRRALWKFGVEMFKHYKSRSKFTVKGHVEGHTFKIYATVRKALSQGTHMPNMNVLYLRIEKLWPMLKIFKSRSKVTVKVTCSKFMALSEGLVIRNTHAKYESPISQDKKVMPNNKVFQK